MTGSLQEKNGKFYLVLNISENGKRKQKWISTGLTVKGNKRRANELLKEKLREYETQTEIAKSDILFSDYIREWLTCSKRRVDEVTYQGYKLTAEGQVIPYFRAKNSKLSDITTEMLQEYFDDRSKNGRKDGKGGLSPASIRHCKNIINQTLNEAVKSRLITFNPCQFVELPKKEQYKSDYYNASQLKALFEIAKGDPLYPLIQLAALYGLRRSEVLGLKWDSVDFESKRVTIKHTVVRTTAIVEKDKTKNKSSYRSFVLSPEAEAIFKAAKAAEKENRRLCGREYHENDYVFKWPDGKPFSPSYVSSHFALLLKNNNLPHIRFHELRHSCASLLLNNGFTLKDVQEYMGHSDIQMTANIYGHLDTSRKETLTNTIADSVFSSR